MPTNIYQDMPETFNDIPDDVFENIPRAVTARVNNRKARTKADLNVDKSQEVIFKIVTSILQFIAPCKAYYTKDYKEDNWFYFHFKSLLR